MSYSKNDQVRIRYMQLGKYRVTLTGVIESWKGSEIGFYDQNKRYYNLTLDNVLRIEPVLRKADDKDFDIDGGTEQSSLDEFL